MTEKLKVSNEVSQNIAENVTKWLAVILIFCTGVICSGIAAGLGYRLFIWISGIGY